MRTLHAIVLILACGLLVVGVTGCMSARTPIGVDKTAPAHVQAAQAAINEARIAIGTAAGVVAQQKRDGIITAAQRDVFVARLEAMALDVKEAERLKDLGDLAAANKANAARTVILLLQKELAAKAKEVK